MDIDTDTLRNDHSSIAADRNINITANLVENVGTDLEETTVTTTVIERYERHCSIFQCSLWPPTWSWTVTPDPDIDIEVLDAVFATIHAGGTVNANVSGYLHNGAVTSGAEARPDSVHEDTLDEVQVDEGIEDSGLGTAPVETPTETAEEEGVADTSGVRRLVTLTNLQVSIDSLLRRTALFVEQLEPEMPYLIETRPEFVDRTKYLGSDYFLERVGLVSADQILKRLGDSYVETRLIRDQLFSLTGYRYLGGARNDRAQMQALYDNAIDAYQSLKLTIGVALSPSQIASLGNDIIWLERHTIQGQEVLVPRLYLAASTLEGLDLGNARIAGSETVIKSAYLVNTGAIVGTDALTLETTQDLFNQGGSLLSEGTIDMDVGGLFANRDGTVSGGGIVDIAADSMLNTGSITGTAGLFVETTSDLLNEGGSLVSEGNIGLDVGGLFANREGTVSGGGIVGIVADSMVNTGAITGSGGLAVQTVNNLLNWGGSLRSEGDIGLNVGGQFANRSGTVAGGGNVSISAAEILNETEVIREQTAGGFVDRIGQVATIAAGGELNLQADGAIRSIGGALRSGGDTTLDAGGDIEIAAVQLQSEQRRSGSGGQDNRRSVTHELATIETGGNLQVTAGGDLTVRGATVEAGGDATLYAAGDTTIESVQDRRWSATRQGSDRRTETSTETQRTTIRAGGEVTVGARTGDVTLDAVSLVSGGDTNLVAEQGTVLLLTETDESGSTSFRRRSSRLEWSETDQGRSDETIEHVELEYGGELRISAGEGVVVEYEHDGSLAASLNGLTGSPELAWMDELRGDGDVEWQGVEASSESWYRSSSGLTAAGKAAAAQAAAESQKSVAGSEDPGVSSLRGYGAGLPSAAGGGGGGGQLLAGVQGAPRNTILQTSKDRSGSESGSSQGGTTGGSDTSTVTLKTVDITEPAPLPYDPYAPWLFGSGYTTHPSGEGTTETVTLGLADIEVPTSDTVSDGNGAGGGEGQSTTDNEAPAGSPTDDQDDDRQKSLCELIGMLAVFGCGDPGMQLEPGQFVDQTDDQQADQQHVQLEEHFTISLCFPFMPCWWEQAQTIVFVDRDDESRNPDEAEETAGNRSPWDDLPPTPDPQDVVQAAEDAADSSAAAGDSAAVVEPEPTVLQTGGNTIRNRTAQLLNEQFDMNLHRRDWGRALEALKDFVGQPGQLHGKIMSDGTLVDETGRVIGNILDFIP